jgi:UDP-glucose 4-epimerase
MTPPVTLVIGGRGLLGSRLVAAIQRRGGSALTHQVRWGSPDSASADLEGGAARLLDAAGDTPWRMAWCAGAAVTSSSRADLDAELGVLQRFLDNLAALTQARGSRSGSVFLASSAGGVYAGSDRPPFDEYSDPHPISGYGEAKLAAERLVHDYCARTGARGVVGRIANLYGPGQDIRKPQGLIAHLCHGHLTGQPVTVYVSLDTLRDYIYVDDCAEMILDAFDRNESETGCHGESRIVTKVFASQRSVSIGALLGESGRVFHRPIRVLVAASPFAAAQARDLRLRSVVWPELDQRALVPLPAGIAATAQDIHERWRASRSA